MKRIILLMALAVAFALPGYAQIAGNIQTNITYPLGSDPCQNPSVKKLSAKVAISSATTTELVAAAPAGQVTYVCGFTASVVGTTPTIKFATGTKVSTACDTGEADLTGVMAIVTTTLVDFKHAFSFVQSASAGELCLVTTGSGLTVEGAVQYVTGTF